MITRKPLPETAPHVNIEGTSDQAALAAAPGAEAQQTEEPDSDVDSWERASASEDEDEAEDQDISESPPHKEEKEHKPTFTEVGDAAARSAGYEYGGTPSMLPPAMDTAWEDTAKSNTPASTPDPPAPSTATSAETNPFRRKMSLSQSSGQHGATVPPTPTETPPLPPSDSFAKLSLHDAGSNPWQPEVGDHQKTLAPSTLSTAADQEPAQHIWASQVPSRAPSTGPPPPPAYPAEQSVPQDDKTSWGIELPEPGKSSIDVPPSFRKPLGGEALEEDSHAWDDLATKDKGKAPMTALPVSSPAAEGAREDEWNLIDSEPAPGSSNGVQPTRSLLDIDDNVPTLPPRKEEKAPAKPPRTPISTKTETYQVKNIKWHDAFHAKNPRESPILVQNANGPCPLMALVNALTLSTPVGVEDAVLVNTLKTREQISLDLLLNAVFDELMSERRMTPDVSLPDITELYDFLKGLHTGMNVNPRFIPTEETEKAFKRTSLTHLHPTERGDLIPGTFEDTREMAFYRTFQIPLIHGWLPSREDPAYGALKRQAESYEDAQNILFREEELEDRLSNPNGQGLSETEQGIYQDVLSIKCFLYSAATQLTPWGLKVITSAMRPGSVAILFRNDHFSTLYRHPQTLQIFALVTDAGYAGHEEVVWESLVDVNGERSEFFSGDFRVVGGPAHTEASGSASASNHQGQWTTAQGKKGKAGTEPEGSSLRLSPKEQEDHDLALALQLQEEEDQRHRNEQAQRRRETQLSEQFIEQQAVRRGPVGLRQASNNNGAQQPATSPAPSTPGRQTSTTSVSGGGATNSPARGARPAQQQVRPLVPPVVRSRGVNRPSDADDDDAPPSYEDAAKDRPYIPPAGHPSHPESSSIPSVGSSAASASVPRLTPSRAPGTAGIPQNSVTGGFRRGNSAYRQGVPPTAASGVGRDKDCVVM